MSVEPLAAKLRPDNVTHFIGQEHILGPGKPLAKAIELGQLHSMILWGPPGTGKTTLANIMAQRCDACIEKISAVMAGVKDIRDVVKRAQQRDEDSILFIDEIHRFNKSQQDALLPHVENGLLTLIGATTENPSFSLNNALLSRCRVYVFKALDAQHLLKILRRALDEENKKYDISCTDDSLLLLAELACGDARYGLNLLELCINYQLAESPNAVTIDKSVITSLAEKKAVHFDRQGDLFYDQISALHKSIRGSDPDASLYWLARMLQGGCDPLYIARRLVRVASEDVGNADPRALQLSLNTWDVVQRLGSPEGELALGQAVSYLAVAAKSNACYTAFNAAMADAKKHGELQVPIHLRNAPTKLMENLGYGKAYQYAHDMPHGYVPGEQYFPDQLQGQKYYHPVERGMEIKIKQKLEWLKSLEKG